MSTGILTVNIEPMLGWDCTSMSPPNAFANSLLMLRPKPTPQGLSSRWFARNLLKRMKSPLSYLAVMPTPVSYTLSVSMYLLMLGKGPFSDPITFTDPNQVYFKAFESRFIIICFKRFLSVIIVDEFSASSLLSNQTSRSKFFSQAFNLNTFRHSCSRSSTLHRVMFNTNDFASICAKSRISLIRKSMRFAQFVAISRNYWPLSSTLFLRILRDEIMPLSGFLNS